VIPVHNCANYLARALPEVVSQLADRDDAEIIVVDDASSDYPDQVIDRLPRSGPVPAESGASRCPRNVQPLPHARDRRVGPLLHGDDAVLPGFYTAMDKHSPRPP
jgi:glycosyltransferase involved in cell wall biosynthesis